MRASRYLIATVKETPSDAEVISHQLMLRAGLIRKLASGLYTWLPTGLRVLRKVEGIVREEMNKVGSLEVMMPVVQPAELWQESGRWEQYGAELLRVSDRHNREFCLGPTHEEVITDLIRNEISSYKQLPANFYQIQTKFRDEIRPRFGVMRSREFIMKDAYSFHADPASLEKTYDAMYQSYCAIFDRIGLDYRAVLADNGSIGGNASHEFHVLADSGEDDIVFSNDSDYAANIEMAPTMALAVGKRAEQTELVKVATPNQHTIDEVAAFLKIDSNNILKTLIVQGESEEEGQDVLVALVLRGDHTLNDIKAAKLKGVAQPLAFATDEQIKHAIGCSVGSIGPIDLPIKTLIDHAAAATDNFTCGANEDGFHLTNANWLQSIESVDIRNAVEGDPSPCGKGSLQIKRGIEVGHIFQLGEKYADAMKATILNDKGKATTITMGCYGIGITRIVAAAIEQNHDEKGIIWPSAIAPFQVAIVPINLHKSQAVAEYCERVYKQLIHLGIEVIYMDEHKARLGVLLADTELMGIPHRIVVGDKGLEAGEIEYKARRADSNEAIAPDNVIDFLQQRVSS